MGVVGLVGWIIAALSGVVAAWAGWRWAALRREIASVRAQLTAHRSLGSTQPLEVVVRDDELEALAAEIDTCINAERNAVAVSRAAEARLRREIANLSHDLKTPLIAVRGFLQLVRRDGLSAPNAGDRLEVVARRVDDLGRLVDDFFELSVLDSGERSLELTRVDATTVVGEVLTGFYAAFQQAGVTPRVKLPERTVTVRAEPTALGRVVRNLVANALAYTTGEVAVELSAEGGQMLLAVSNPTDLPPGVADQLFERFYRADQARTGPHAGLGLSIVAELVAQMGGVVQARADSGQLVIEVRLEVWQHS